MEIENSGKVNELESLGGLIIFGVCSVGVMSWKNKRKPADGA